jgi:hypothetical protein
MGSIVSGPVMRQNIMVKGYGRLKLLFYRDQEAESKRE